MNFPSPTILLALFFTPILANPAATDPLTVYTGFTVPTSETSTPTNSGSPVPLPSPISVSTESTTSSVGSIVTGSAFSILPTGLGETATDSLSGVASATGTTASATASATGSGGVRRGFGEEGSMVALVVALGMGVAGFVM